MDKEKDITLIKFGSNMIIVSGGEWVVNCIMDYFKKMGYEPTTFKVNGQTNPLSDLTGRLNIL